MTQRTFIVMNDRGMGAAWRGWKWIWESGRRQQGTNQVALDYCAPVVLTSSTKEKVALFLAIKR